MQDFALYEENLGTATAARTPTTAVTVSNSIIEKPLLFNLFRVFASMPTSILVLCNDVEFYLSHTYTKKYARPHNRAILIVNLNTYLYSIVEFWWGFLNVFLYKQGENV